jgi:hypothetical protein
MQKFILFVLCVAGLYLAVLAYGADTNQAATNQVQNSVTSTNAAQKYSDAELHFAAQEISHKLILYGLLALIGGLVVAGFAFYGAYKAFGVKGVIGVGIIIVIGFFVVGSILIQAF